MNSVLLMLASLLSHADPQPAMRFVYEPAEGARASSCTHERIRDLPDWKVSCETEFGNKLYTAHVILREFPGENHTSLEVLYWVTEPGEKPRRSFHSTSAMLRLRGATSLEGLSLAQGVENDFASLVLRWERAGESKR